ncbi:MAG: M56 family metallopeptidase [FCB group bacterium]|jgi:beta-lactamase regulating signal transducer with metallopeptidase domain/Leucine-rich repeat (LRR) protein|nr:M56 family metallopeptidase [FCB group bacterium]
MDAHIAFANALASQWTGTLWSAFWQSTVLAAAILVLTSLLKGAPASLRYWLWMLVPLRLLIMPLLSISLPVLPAAPVDVPIPAQEYVSPAANGYAPALSPDEPASLAALPSAPAAAPLERARTPLEWQVYVLLAWVAGALVLSLRMLRGWRWMRRLVREGETLTDGPVVDAAFKAAAMLGLKRIPRLVVTEALISPFTCGVRRPVVVLPRVLAERPGEPGLLAVLAHECAHLRRRDSLFGIVLGICDTLYFFHPVVHWVRRRILLEREKACDGLVLATSKAKASDYARAICSAAQVARNTRPLTGSPVFVSESFGDLKHRLTSLASSATHPVKLSRTSLASLVVLGAVCVPEVMLTAAAPAQTPIATQALQATTAAFPTPAQQGSTRIIHFPPDRTLGVLSVATAPVAMRFRLGPNYDAVDRWEIIGPAQGDVAVPAGREVKLTIQGVALHQDLSPLLNLGPNDLHALEVFCYYDESLPVDQRVMPYIVGLTGLRELDIMAPELTDWGMQGIAGLTSLRHLTLHALRVTATGMRHLENLQSLETLLAWNSLTDDALASIANLSSLRELSLNATYLQGPGIEHLARLPRLQHLELQGKDFGDGGLRYLRALPALKSLTLRGDGMRISDAGMRSVAGLTGLEQLRLVRLGNITDVGIAELRSLRALRVLDLHHSVTTDAALAYLSEMESLEDIMLSNNSQTVLTDAGLAHLTRLKNLKRLWTMSWSKAPITDAGLESLSTIETLRDLHIGGGEGITDQGIGYLARLPQLEAFGLLSDSKGISDESLAHISGIRTLQRLDITCPQVEFTVSGVNRLNALSKLTFLKLLDVRHDDAVLNLSGLTQLREASITLVPYWDADLECFGRLTSLRRLQSLAGIGDEGLAHLAGLTQLQTLYIYKSHLTDEGLRHVAGMRGLDFLAISGSFDGTGLRYLHGLSGLRTLTISNNLNLSGPALESALQSVEQLKAALPSLTTLNLQGERGAGGYGG